MFHIFKTKTLSSPERNRRSNFYPGTRAPNISRGATLIKPALSPQIKKRAMMRVSEASFTQFDPILPIKSMPG